VNHFYDAIYPALPIFAQSLVITAGGWSRFRARFNRHFHETLREWEQTVDGPLERLHEIQRRRLDRLVERAREHVPYYRDLPPPSDHRDPHEAMQRTLAAIPPLEKRAYRDQPDAFIARDVAPNRLYRGKTSGTTGTALPLWYTREALAEEYATVWRMRRTCGVHEPSEPNLTFNGQIIVPFKQIQPPFWRTNAYVRQTLFSVYHMTPMNLRSYVDAIHSAPARYVQGYPSSIHLVARTLLREERPLPAGRIAAVFTSSESLLSFQRETIEKAFAAPVRDRYGVGEFGVSMTHCEQRRHHVDMEFCLVEVETTEETDDYEAGPLLITGLANDATPLFRYRIGDVGTRSKKPCPCGRPGDVFFEVDGRIEDYVLTPDGRLVGRLDHVFKEQLDVAEAQILQDSKDAIDVLVVPRSTYTDLSGRRLLKEIRSRLGQVIEIRIHLVDHIPREPNGKFRAVKSRVGSITQ
jgi:phenylacetate-CoA ligase